LATPISNITFGAGFLDTKYHIQERVISRLRHFQIYLIPVFVFKLGDVMAVERTHVNFVSLTLFNLLYNFDIIFFGSGLYQNKYKFISRHSLLQLFIYTKD